MKRHATFASLISVVLLLLSRASNTTALGAATECEDVRTPIRIPGALCGMLSDAAGEPLDESDVQLLDGSTVIATTRSDKAGRFTFARVPAGRYAISSPGFSQTGLRVLVTDAQATRCTRRVQVMLGVGSCISSVWSGGGLRLRVNSKEPADVTIDGGYYGPRGGFNGDFELVELPAGSHHVEIDAVDYESVSFDVTTREFAVVTRTVTLKRRND